MCLYTSTTLLWDTVLNFFMQKWVLLFLLSHTSIDPEYKPATQGLQRLLQDDEGSLDSNRGREDEEVEEEEEEEQEGEVGDVSGASEEESMNGVDDGLSLDFGEGPLFNVEVSG